MSTERRRSLRPPSILLPTKREATANPGPETMDIGSSKLPLPKTTISTPTRSDTFQSPHDKSPTATLLDKRLTPTRVVSDPTFNSSFHSSADIEGTRRELESLKDTIGAKEEALDELKTGMLTTTTQIQQLEVDNGDLESTVNNLSKELRIKMNALDNLKIEQKHLDEEMKQTLELRIREMNADAESNRYSMERRYMDEIELVMNSKVRKIQEQKSSLKHAVDQLQSKIDNNPSELENLLKVMKENYANEQEKIKKHMDELRSSLESELITLRDEKVVKQENLLAVLESIKTKETEKLQKNEELAALRDTNRSHYQKIKDIKQQIEDEKNKITQKELHHKEIENEIYWKTTESQRFKTDLVEEELFRRKLHNRMQDLKGNIRVFCRIRPPLKNEDATDMLEIRVPDNEEEEQTIEITDPKSLQPSNVFTKSSSSNPLPLKTQSYKFDRVFQMNSTNAEIFEEISQLAQSALDGFNVCVFAYGQTGSGKTYTMSNKDGMIPRVVDQIFEVSEQLKERGWIHKVYGEFLEIYNENINDLLGNPQNIDKVKYEIRHDTTAQRTTVTDLSTVEVTSPEMMNELLNKALQNRSIAATKANERSSRSHTVFIIRINGENSKTGEKVEGVLNLIDLAGSERLSHSQATGDRLKETQSINKSLSCLGDVIYALNDQNSRVHIPFRNSKLTYLLQYSLSGNSKTLMFVNASPFAKYFNETINSLRFATKVNNTKVNS